VRRGKVHPRGVSRCSAKNRVDYLWPQSSAEHYARATDIHRGQSQPLDAQAPPTRFSNVDSDPPLRSSDLSIAGCRIPKGHGAR
jgi:hypothetical protein